MKVEHTVVHNPRHLSKSALTSSLTECSFVSTLCTFPCASTKSWKTISFLVSVPVLSLMIYSIVHKSPFNRRLLASIPKIEMNLDIGLREGMKKSAKAYQLLQN